MKLAKWEDRGYYALRTSAEKAQRQLHKLQRRAASALAQPSAGVLAAASRAMGLADLAAPELPAELPAAGKQPKKKRRAAAAAAEPDWDAQVTPSCFRWSGAQAVILVSFVQMLLVLCIYWQHVVQTVLMELPHAPLMLGSGSGFVTDNGLHINGVCGSAGAALLRKLYGAYCALNHVACKHCGCQYVRQMKGRMMSAKLLLIGDRCRADACVWAKFPHILPLPLTYRDCNVQNPILK